MTTTDNHMKGIGAESADVPKQGTDMLLGDRHIGMEDSVEEQNGQGDIPVAERTRIARDLARRTGIESKRNGVVPSYAACEIDFRGHHQANSVRRWGSYEVYRLVYRYGFDLGVDPRYRTTEWTIVEQDARPRWEERNPGTWEEFKDAIRFAWDTARK